MLLKNSVKKEKRSFILHPLKVYLTKYYGAGEIPEISFGILAGDVKFNPEADCLIMTTEILRNTLFQKEAMDNDKTNTIFTLIWIFVMNLRV